jgi:hypothetical protein
LAKLVVNEDLCQHLTILTHGEHGVRQIGMCTKLFSLHDEASIAAAVAPDERLTSQKVKDAFRKAQVDLACTPRQLQQYVTRWNRALTQPGARETTTVLELQETVTQWLREQPTLQQAHVADLLVLGTPTISDARVCVAWSSRGMLSILPRVQGLNLAVILDAKLRVLDNKYGVLTIGLLQRQADRSVTTLSREAGPRPSRRGRSYKPSST